MRWVGIAVLLVLAALFGLLAIGNAVLLEETREVWARGKVAEGTLVAQHARKKSGKAYSYTYEVEGRTLTAERRGIPWAASELPVGSKLVVRYDPADPDRSVTPAELKEWENWANRAFLPSAAAALLGWAIFLMARGGKKPTSPSPPARPPPTSSS